MNGDKGEHDGRVTCKLCKYFYWYLPEPDKSRKAVCVRLLFAPKTVSIDTTACADFKPKKRATKVAPKGGDTNDPN